MMGTFRSKGRDGYVDRPCAYVKGPLAVARPVGNDDWWMVGHVASGLSCGAYRYPSIRAAKAALHRILPLADWTDARLTIGDVKWMGLGFEDKIRAIAKDVGAVDCWGEAL